MIGKRVHRRNFNIAAQPHELTFCCYQGFKFLNAERSCNWLAEAINAARTKAQFDLWAFVFMPEHVHLLIRSRQTQYDIAVIRKTIKAAAAKRAIHHMQRYSPHWLPRISRQRGSKTERLFWQSGGGYDRNITEPSTLLAAIDYIHLNPVRRGLVLRAEEWRWSSAGWYAGQNTLPLVPDKLPAESIM